MCKEVFTRNNTGFRCGQRVVSRAKRAFTLLELLVVMGIISILIAMSGVAVMSVVSVNPVNRSVEQIKGALEYARERAMSRNTYTWVAFTAEGTNPEDPVYMAVFESRDGWERPVLDMNQPNLSQRKYTTTPIVVGSTVDDEIRPSRAVVKLEGVKIDSGPNSVPSSNTELRQQMADVEFRWGRTGTGDIAIEKLAGELGASDPAPTFSYPVRGQTYTFTRSIEFTPFGQGRVTPAYLGDGPALAVQITVIGKPGGVLQEENAGVVLVSGATSQVRAYWP